MYIPKDDMIKKIIEARRKVYELQKSSEEIFCVLTEQLGLPNDVPDYELETPYHTVSYCLWDYLFNGGNLDEVERYLEKLEVGK